MTAPSLEDVIAAGRTKLLALSSDYTTVKFVRHEVGSTQGEEVPGFVGPGEWVVQILVGENIACQGTGVNVEAAIQNAEKAAAIDIRSHGRTVSND